MGWFRVGDHEKWAKPHDIVNSRYSGTIAGMTVKNKTNT